MTVKEGEIILVDIYDEEIAPDQLQIKLENPRHEKKDQYPAAMKELVDSERVVELALNIAEMGGLNPMDRIGVVRDQGSPDDAPTYIAAEGNRRVAALMLLNDPESVPSSVNQRTTRVRRLKKAGESFGEISKVRVVVFPTFEAADTWVDVMHVVGNDGGRKRWNPTQQARRNGETGNVDAVSLISTARKSEVITKGEADRIKATNIQRIVSSNARRKQLGLTGTGEDLKRTISWNSFQIGIRKIMRDQLDHPSDHNSRALNTADKLNGYVALVVRAMGAPEHLPNGEARPLLPTKEERNAFKNTEKEEAEKSKKRHSSKNDGEKDDDQNFEKEKDTTNNSENFSSKEEHNRSNAPRGGTVSKDIALENEIAKLNDANLTELYTSITTVSARQHPVLVCIGCSTFLELLFKKSGWDEKGKIVQRIIDLPEVREKYSPASLGSVKEILSGLRGRANLGKHDTETGGVHGDALVKDMMTLNGVFVALADLAVRKKQEGK